VSETVLWMSRVTWHPGPLRGESRKEIGTIRFFNGIPPDKIPSRFISRAPVVKKSDPQLEEKAYGFFFSSSYCRFGSSCLSKRHQLDVFWGLKYFSNAQNNDEMLVF
jgi:hypothetical protein